MTIIGLPDLSNIILLVVTKAALNPVLLKLTSCGDVKGFSAIPIYQSTWLSFPRQIVIVRDSGLALAGPFTGIARSIAFGLASVVAIIKKVISKKARSTIAVRSIRGDILLTERLLPDFSEAFNSAMTLSFR